MSVRRWLLAGLWLVGCDDVSPLSLTLLVPPAPLPGEFPDEPFVGLDELVFRATDGDQVVTASFPADASGLSLPLIPFGEGWVFSVEGLTGGVLRSRGATAPLSLQPGGEREATLFFGQVNAFHLLPEQPPLSSSCAVGRESGCATLCALSDGRALLLGDEGAAVFDPIRYTFTPIGSLDGRQGAGCVDLAGEIIGIGGQMPGQASLATSWAMASSGEVQPLSDPDGLLLRVGHQTTSLVVSDPAGLRLADGEVLPEGTALAIVTGGLRGSERIDTAALVIVSPGERARVAPLRAADGSLLRLSARTEHSATLVSLPGGSTRPTLLLAGGRDETGAVCGTAELLDLSTGARLPLALTTPRAEHAAVLLSDGDVLLTGGLSARGVALSSTERFSPIFKSFAPGPELIDARAGHTATRLQSGQVLVAGGFAGRPEEPEAGTGGSAGPLVSPSALPEPVPATRLQPLLDGEFFDPNAAPGGAYLKTRDLRVPRGGHAALLLPDGSVLLVGGKGTSAARQAEDTAEVYTPLP